MKMTTEVIVLQVNHYDMGDNRGVNLRVVASEESTNNKFGLSIVEASCPNYSELSNLRSVAGLLPARFKADVHIISKKLKNDKEAATMALSNLQYINSVEFADVKATANIGK